MRVYRIDPTRDPRWSEFVEQNPASSVFHSAPWLDALRNTYHYLPVVFTTSPPTGPLTNGVVFCQIASWITGRRLISLPFSDHCEPLCDSQDELDFILRYLRAASEHERWRYVEVRPINRNPTPIQIGYGPAAANAYLWHVLDLRPELPEIFRGLDRNSVQRRIRRAGRADLIEKIGRSDLLDDFYRLFVATRSRHCLPPTPFSWFRNLVECLGDALEIRLAYKDGVAISGLLVLRFKDTVYYKYGCSDLRYKKFAATPWLLWRAIEAAKLGGARRFDFGRSDEENGGLVTFKNHWTSESRRLVYWASSENGLASSPVSGWKLRLAKRIVPYLPSKVLTITGTLIYPHIG